MHQTFVLAMVVTAALWSATPVTAQPPEEVNRLKADAEKLLGNWVAVAISRDGRETEVQAGWLRLVVTPDNWSVVVGRGSETKYAWKIDATRSPKELDLVQRAGAREITTRCLYEIRGSQLFVCETTVSDQPRPKTMLPGNRLIYTVWERPGSPANTAPDDPRVEACLKILGDPDKSLATKRQAVLDLATMGSRAKTAIPTIRDLAISGPEAQFFRTNAVSALGQIGEAAIPSLLEIAEKGTPDVGDVAINRLGQMGPAAKSAVPGLIKLLNAPAPRGIKYHVYAARVVQLIGSISRIGPDPATFVPALVKFLENPELVPARKPPQSFDPNWTQIAGASLVALAKLGPDAKPAIPILIKYLDSRSQIAGGAIAVLGAIGPDAAPALDALRKFRDQTGQGSAGEIEKAIDNIKAK